MCLFRNCSKNVFLISFNVASYNPLLRTVISKELVTECTDLSARNLFPYDSPHDRIVR